MENETGIPVRSTGSASLPVDARYVMCELMFYTIEREQLENLSSAGSRFRAALSLATAFFGAGVGLIIEPLFMGETVVPELVKLISWFGGPICILFAIGLGNLARIDRKREKDLLDRIRKRSSRTIPVNVQIGVGGSGD